MRAANPKTEQPRAPRDYSRQPKPGTVTKYFFDHGLGDALMMRSVMPALTRQIKLAIPASKRYGELFERDPWVSELVQDDSSSWTRVKMPAEDCLLPLSSGRPTKTRYLLEYDFGVHDVTFRTRPRPLDLSWVDTHEVRVTQHLLKEVQGPYVVVHGKGASSPKRKDCSDEKIGEILSAIYQCGFESILIDYDAKVPLLDVPHRSTAIWDDTAACLWHLLKGAHAFIGIDSGPLHMALTIPDLPCVFLKNRINFMRLFYDAGLEQIRSVLHVEANQQEINRTIRNLI